MDRPGRTAAVTLAILLMLAVMPRAASAVRAPADRGPANVDRRADVAAPVPNATKVARRDLERDLGTLADVRTQRASGAVAYVGSATGLLSAPSDDDPRDIALAYVRDHDDAFGLTDADIANLRLVARDVSPDGITHLRYNQLLDGIESFDSGLEAHVTRDGRLITISGSPLAHARLDSSTPALSASAALGAARIAARGSIVPPKVARTRPGAARDTTFATGERARLRWAATASGPRLAWDVIADGEDAQAYAVLVDAAGGEMLRRQGLTEHLGQARYFPRDPDHTPAQVQITMAPAWYDDHANGTRLWGQYARTYTDPGDEDPDAGAESGGTRGQVPASAGAPAAPDWLYTQSHDFPGATPCPVSLCTWNSDAPATASVNAKQAATNLHVLNSRFHDYLAAAPIGFDAASGNFQRTNPAGQGLGNDYVRSEVNDGQGLNNANMSTGPDGDAPRMQMFLFAGDAGSSTRDVNGSDIADIVYHEYTHGLSARLVVNASGGSTLASNQARQMGEAWSDFYAFDLLQAEGSVTDTAAAGEVVSGDYVVGPGGVRAKPIDCPVDPTGATATCNANHTATTVLGGYTYGDLTRTNNGSPHNGGEVWAQTLWDIRAALGRTAALALVTGGMRLSPDNPSMLDMRDAILQQALATRSAVGAADDHYAALWAMFAARGFGGTASTPGPDSTNPTESFDQPHGLRAGTATLRDPYPGGDADGVIEPGEAFEIDQPVTGIAVFDFTGTTGSLSTANPATAIVDGTAAWPLLGRGRTAVNSDPLVARLPAADCTTRTTLTIAVTSSDGNTSASTIVDPRPASTTVVPILDNTTASATFVPTGSGTITDVDVRIDDLRHPYLGDLEIALEHDGVTRTVFDPSNGWNGDDVVDAIIDDEAAGAMPNAGPGPVTGRVRPSIASALSGFDGHPVAGPWTLRINDIATGDDGTLRRWGVQGPQVACPRAEIPQAQTGAASAVTTTSATIAGAVTPNGRQTGRRFAYGTTTAYGSTTPVQAAGSGDAAAAGEAPISGLVPGTTYHFRVEAVRENGIVAVAGADATFTTPPVATPPVAPARDLKAPSFLGTLTAKPGARVRGKRRVAFGFRLSEAATVRVVLTRRARGGRSQGRCVAPRKGRPRCTRQRAAGSASRAFKPAGSKRLRFTPAKRLGRGVYTAKLTATDAAGNRSKPKTVRFTVR